MRRSKVLEFNPAGVNVDSMPASLGPEEYSGAHNMRSTGSGMTRADGEIAFTPRVPIAPKWGIIFEDNGAQQLLACGDAGCWKTDGGAWVNVTPAAGWLPFESGTMTGGLLNGYPVFSAPGMVPWWYDGGAAAAPLPGWFAGQQCVTLAPFNQHVFAGSVIASNIDNERLAWSDAATLGGVPVTWTPTTANQAGDLYLGMGAGPVMCMLPLAQNLMVYRTQACYAVAYAGRPFIYTARKVSGEIGAASQHAAAQIAAAHVVMTPGDFVLWDGSSGRSLGDGRVKRSIFAQLSEEGLKRCHAYTVQSRNEVVFCLALGRDDVCNTAYVWDLVRDRWSLRDLPEVTHTASGIVPQLAAPLTWENDAGIWEADTRPWNSPPQGGYKPAPAGFSPTLTQVFTLDAGDARADGGSIQASVERSGLVLGEEQTVKLVSAIYPRIQGTAGQAVSVQVGGQMAGGDPVNWAPAQQWLIGSTKRVDCSVQGRFVAVRFAGEGLAPWSVSGFGVEFQTRGLS
jgi:hypothetical protein